MTYYKVFVSDDPMKIEGELRNIAEIERTPGGFIITFHFLSDACKAMTAFRNSGYKEVFPLWV